MTQDISDRRHSRRRHRQGSDARRPARARRREQALRHRARVPAHRMGELRLLREARPDDARRLEGATRKTPTRSCSARSAGRTPCPITSRCGARCSSSAANSTSTSTCARRVSSTACPRRSRAARPGDIDFMIVRENTEGEYSSVGGVMFEGTEREFVMQESIFTRKGTRARAEVRVRSRASAARRRSRSRRRATASRSACRGGTRAPPKSPRCIPT